MVKYTHDLMDDPDQLWWDLFAGAGGFSTGAEEAEAILEAEWHSPTFNLNRKVAHVITCVNHDKNAIKSHEANHPDALHFTEDIRTLDLAIPIEHTRIQKTYYPKAKLCLMAGLECIEHSKAKGGKPRKVDSRTLANDLFRYVDDVEAALGGFDLILIENVEEFMAWGPMDEKGKPLSRKRGHEYVRWCNQMQERGYRYDYRLLNAADFGAYTSRRRYFGIFSKPGIPVHFPTPTHAKKPTPGSGLKKWKAVKDVLDFTDEGTSIFTRKKPLSNRTMERIYSGLVKFIAHGDTSLLKQGHFLSYQYGNGYNTTSDVPAGTLTAKDRIQKIEYFITRDFGNTTLRSIDEPAGALLSEPKHSLVRTENWLMSTHFKNKGGSVDEPAKTITANRKYDYLMFPQWGVNCNYSTDKPSPTLLARMDKMAPKILFVDGSNETVAIPVFEKDNEVMVKIKTFMAVYGIIDIKMRMLRIPELKKITGLKEDYTLIGTQAEQKKYIGNAVVVDMAKAIVESLAAGLREPAKQLSLI